MPYSREFRIEKRRKHGQASRCGDNCLPLWVLRDNKDARQDWVLRGFDNLMHCLCDYYYDRISVAMMLFLIVVLCQQPGKCHGRV